jgi:hypothetical protein
MNYDKWNKGAAIDTKYIANELIKLMHIDVEISNSH